MKKNVETPTKSSIYINYVQEEWCIIIIHNHLKKNNSNNILEYV